MLGIGQERPAHVPLVVKLGGLMAVVYRQYKPAAEPPPHVRDPCAGLEIYFRLLALRSHDVLLLKRPGDFVRAERSALFPKTLAVKAGVNLTQRAALEDHTMHGKGIQQFV